MEEVAICGIVATIGALVLWAVKTAGGTQV